MRSIALDVHQSFCEVAIRSPGPLRAFGERVRATASERNAERGLAERGEAAYRRLVADWRASGAERRKAGTGDRGAHQKQRGRDQPQDLRFSSGSPAPAQVSQEEVQSAEST